MVLDLREQEFMLLQWINGHGFVELDHIAYYTHLSSRDAYQRIKRLIAKNYIIFEQVLHARQGIYRVSKKGVDFSLDDLSPLSRINLANYNHNLLLVEISLFLNIYYGGLFIPERRLRKRHYFQGIGAKGHISDGEYYLGNKCVAIEIELSSKGKFRREKILKYYTKHFEYDELWYICGSNVIKQQISSLIAKRSFVKLFNVEEFKLPPLGTKLVSSVF